MIAVEPQQNIDIETSNVQEETQSVTSAEPIERFPNVLDMTQNDLKLLLAAQSHVGAENCNRKLRPYVFTRRPDGVHIINLRKTWEKILLAARILVTIENPRDICVICSRTYGQRAALKFSKYTNTNNMVGKFIPGTFTNYITRSYIEPRVLLVTDPYTDQQAIREASYVNVPIIAFCDVDSPIDYVDVVIPINNKGKHSIGLMYWLLAREILRMRGVLLRENEWDVMVDMFFYRDLDAELEQETKNNENEIDEEERQMIQENMDMLQGDQNQYTDWGAPETNEDNNAVQGDDFGGENQGNGW